MVNIAYFRSACWRNHRIRFRGKLIISDIITYTLIPYLPIMLTLLPKAEGGWLASLKLGTLLGAM